MRICIRFLTRPNAQIRQDKFLVIVSWSHTHIDLRELTTYAAARLQLHLIMLHRAIQTVNKPNEVRIWTRNKQHLIETFSIRRSAGFAMAANAINWRLLIKQEYEKIGKKFDSKKATDIK